MTERKIPRVLLAAPSSNSGKTLLTCALLDALKKRGCHPASFKCGPDYIDPMFHKEVLQVEGRNLDSFFMAEHEIRQALGGCSGDCAVIEGVMGIYDGTDVRSDRDSSYEIARVTGTPVVLIADALKTGRTLISGIKGILSDDREGLIRGLILNRIGDAFYASLRPVLEAELFKAGYHAEILGYVPMIRDAGWKSRHLGLILPGEIEGLYDQIETVGKRMQEHVDLDRLLHVMEEAPGICSQEENSRSQSCGSPEEQLTLAVAHDAAFCFYYAENLELFAKKGVKIRFFSPISDSRIPEDASGILLGGGYPELFLEELSHNTSMLSGLRSALLGGMPSLAECGGFMYLHRGITDEAGRRFEMAGVVDGECFYTGHPVRFGYMELGEPLECEDPYRDFSHMRGHEFHYYDSTCNGKAFTARKPCKDSSWNCMVSAHNGLWGFPHLYYGSKTSAIDLFTDRMRKYRNGHK